MLGKAGTPEIPNGSQNKAVEVSMASGDNSIGLRPEAPSLTTAFLKILLEETGLLESELEPSATFFEIGVDSVMSISIMAALKAETGIELGDSFLTENPTLEDTQRALQVTESLHASSVISNGYANRHTNGQHANRHTSGEQCVKTPKDSRKSNMVLMQGEAYTPSRASLFLIADGAGSAAAYIQLPKLAKDLKVYALESPWVQDPKNFTCTFSEAAAMYLAAIRAKQPYGPYLLGGWSGGGVFAYEVARLLLIEEEKVYGLIIIDIPAPRHVDRKKLTLPTFDIIDQLGMLAGIDRVLSDVSPQSLQLKEHMFSNIRCFSQMDPIPMAADCRPDATFIIWATEKIGPKDRGKLEGLNLDAWFYPTEIDFGPRGWDLVGDGVECFQTQGDHFSIIGLPLVNSIVLPT